MNCSERLKLKSVEGSEGEREGEGENNGENEMVRRSLQFHGGILMAE